MEAVPDFGQASKLLADPGWGTNPPLGSSDPLQRKSKEDSVKKTLIVVALLALVALPLAAWAESGADVYKAKCQMCHGVDAKGKMAGTHDWSSAEVQKMSDADLTKVIEDGKPPKMPAQKGKLTDAQVKDMVSYIRSLKK
jgi:mono/diheme cytochrome c family protein